jgi:predicted RNA-binding Zn-ribbon protein involved in translation (DUF1610 family)
MKSKRSIKLLLREGYDLMKIKPTKTIEKYRTVYRSKRQLHPDWHVWQCPKCGEVTLYKGKKPTHNMASCQTQCYISGINVTAELC